ncbi:hypothetical protein FHS16_000493 [Paenibacillus endophyticus]|uniref:SLH domain-containing protein n=1 Tax=Paenibacillus endophyticus TaxID=1294268 RepID=A0A7W5G8C0_9BACL|nr:S-layer homology domain-containing protein [Paenibacillus endophyticus]MBB3150461.1 hypothetical protein [Paenibacillus endophyticus]
MTSVSIISDVSSLKASTQLTVGSVINPGNATNPIYQWTATEAISIIGESNKETVTIKGVSAGKGKLSLTVAAGGAAKQVETEFTVTASGSSGSDGGHTTPTPGVTGEKEAEILINGKAEHAGTVLKSERNGQTVATISLNQQKLEQWLNSEKEQAVITLSFHSDSNIVIGQLNAHMLKNMADKKAVIELKTDQASYTIPTKLIDIHEILEQLGTSTSLTDLMIEFEIGDSSPEMDKAAKKAAEKSDFNIAASPLDFKMTVISGAARTEITKFSAYVQRMLAIPAGVNPDQMTTAIVVAADGTFQQVPTKMLFKDGKHYAMANSLTNGTFVLVSHQASFTDVAMHWAEKAIIELGSRMVISGTGDGRYSPDREITRAEFAAIVVRGLGLKPESDTVSFLDVQHEDWYSSAVATAYSYKLINGFEDGSFNPQDKITREQAMVIIAKAMELTGLKATLNNQDSAAVLLPYKDAVSASSWAKEAIADNIQAGIVSGRNASTLAPKAFMTRAEVAAIVEQLLKKSGLYL